MSTICHYHLQGRCKFGQNCRNVHSTVQPKPQHSSVPQTEGFSVGVEPAMILGSQWDQLAWKGSPVWDKNDEEPTFKGLDMTMDEVRWEFYQLPVQEWPRLQQIVDQKIESARSDWLAAHAQARRGASMTTGSHLQQSNNAFSQLSIKQSPASQESPFGTFAQSAQQQQAQRDSVISPFNQSCMPQSFNQSCMPQSFNQSCMPQSSPFGSVFQQPTQQQTTVSVNAFGQQPALQTQSPFHTFAPSQTPTVSPFGQCQQTEARTEDQSVLFSQPPSVSPTLNPSPLPLSTATPKAIPYSDWYPQAQELKKRYTNELKEYEVWEIAAFLSPVFEDCKIPTKVPPRLPEF